MRGCVTEYTDFGTLILCVIQNHGAIGPGTMMGKTLLRDSMIPCIQALPAAPAPTSEARSWLQGATTAAEQRNIELRTRSHLLSSVDPVPYGDTNGPTHAPAVVSIAPSAAAVPAPSLGPWRIVRCIVARFIHYALLHANSGQPILVTHATGNQPSSINPP